MGSILVILFPHTQVILVILACVEPIQVPHTQVILPS